jgi:polyhydroxyalkanoate synthase
MADAGDSRSKGREAAAAAEAVGPEASLVGLDPLGLAEAMLQGAEGLLRHPADVAAAGMRFASGLASASAATAARLLGGEANGGPVAPDPKDRRFGDPAWKENPFYFWLLQSYLLSSRFARELVDAAACDERTAQKLEFAAEIAIDALAPTNFVPGNPAAVKKALDTGGASLGRGLRHFLEDVATNGGLPRKVDPTPFKLGKNLAATPGKVVYRSGLMELIQYAPQTETVFETPLLLSPPWINKYYVMDLAPGRSFAEWAVQHGHTVFAISYRNPDASMRGTTLDDYLLGGPTVALDVINEITGSEQANVVGLCLGGTLTAMLLASLAASGDDRVRSATLLNTLLDFSKPGRMGAFTDAASIERVEQRMSRRGYLEKDEMSGIFTFMRGNDLVWNYVVNNWLKGEDPPAFDILVWNEDGTRMPAAMHSFYLRSCYQRNEFARGELELAGRTIGPAQIRADMYLLSAQEDHITPWKGGYSSTRLLENAQVRFVLSSSGHIAGIVNPPGPKGWHRTNDELPADPEAWLAGSSEQPGSWWEDWASWIETRAGERREPPGIGSEKHVPLGDAPGTYVFEQ